VRIEIDQSGKIEDTAKSTIVAFTNSSNYVIKITSKTKRRLQEIFRRKGQIRLFIYRTFATLIFLLIKKHLKRISLVVIDLEYPGKEKVIKDIVLEYLRIEELKEPRISFKRIGNKPKVHYLAHDVFVGKKRADEVIKLNTLIKMTIKK
jgi:hypothetical protein